MKTLHACLSIVLIAAFTMPQDASADDTSSDDAVKIDMDTPKGWSGETISLPPGFAPGMKLKGREVIRFAPGMFQPQSDSFFSYAFVFWLPDRKSLDAKTIEAELLTYYKGLATAVARGQKLEVDPKDFSITMKPVEKKRDSYRVTLKWSEPFRTRKAQTLLFEVAAKKIDGRTDWLLDVAASPQPFNAKIWKQLHSVLESVKISKVTKKSE